MTSCKLPKLKRGLAGIVNVTHVEMSIGLRVNSQPNLSEHTNSFFFSQKTVLVLASSVDPDEMMHHAAFLMGHSLFAKVHI